MKIKLKKLIRPAVFILIGIILGFAYYKVWGCTNGCPVTSSPFWSVLYAGVMGLLTSILFKKKETEYCSISSHFWREL